MALQSKDKVYEIIGLGFLEATDELCVIHQAQYGEKLTFLRPLTIWLDKLSGKAKQFLDLRKCKQPFACFVD